MKDLKKSKTLWFFAIIDAFLLGFLVIEPHLHLLKGEIPAWVYISVIFVISTIGKLLRLVTYEPLAAKRLLDKYMKKAHETDDE